MAAQWPHGARAVLPDHDQGEGLSFRGPATPGVGVVLADQLKSLDWRARNASVIGRPEPVVASVLAPARTLL